MAERDGRFGGNMEVANTGTPYPTGGRDVRFDGSLPPQFQYRDQGRTVVSDTEPGWTDFGRNTSAPRLNQMRDIHGGFGTPNFYQPTGRPNFRAPSGIGGGIGSLQEQAAVDPSDWRNILRILEAGGDPGTETQTAGLWQTWQTIKDRIGEDAANDWLASQQPAYANRGGLMSLRR